ncbi:Hypothetical predicted protein [Paramuricea clavata]|uniref:Uncharacterized protein n=1 Tax=Paramuricea clavata TaxID=317549 RepID=A0A7D9JGV4_PARCT|nr:Hypothetical predicted protein [Paramuricea clavata]
MLDNCCSWRNKIHEVFREETRVLLDLFHVTQRITKKSHPFQANCKHECAMVFRHIDDRGEKCQKETPPKEILIENVDSFTEKWKHISESSAVPLFRDSFEKEVANIRKHIELGCLSNIPPRYTTIINERLHEKINKFFARAKMGPELAFALLTVFFYAWNSQQKNKIGIPIVEPLSLPTNIKTDSTFRIQRKEQFGIGVKAYVHVSNNSQHQQETLDDQSNDSFSKLLERAMSMLHLHNVIKTCSNDGSDLNWQDLFFHNEILKYIYCGSVNPNIEQQANNCTDKQSNTKLINIAACFRMKFIPMSKEGNCLFNAVAFSISQHFLHGTGEYYNYLGIKSTSDVDLIPQRLQSTMTNELKTNREKCMPFLQSMNDKEYDDMVERFDRPGVFARDMGDLMVKALANVLKTHLILLTSYHVITLTPNKFNKVGDKIFITFSPDGPGHYDTLQELETTQEDEKNATEKENKCTCGMNRKALKSKENCKDSKMESGRTYSSCCPCLRAKKVCAELCKCKECSNPFGMKILVEKSGKPKTR